MHEPLRVFYEAVHCGTFTQAAHKLHITQSAVSQHVRRLEEDLGAVLVDRNHRKSMRLTPAGQVVFDHARRILQIEEEMRRRVEDVANVVSGSLGIGASYTIGDYLLPGILAEFCELYPEIEHQVEIYNTPSVMSAVEERRIDLGLVESTVTAKKGVYRVQTIAEDELVIIVPRRHPLADHKQISSPDLAGQTWIVRESGSGTREFTERLFQAQQIRPKRMMAFSSTQGIKEAVRAGLGVAFISKWALHTESSVQGLDVLRLDGVNLSRPLSLIRPPAAVESHAARLFADFVQQRFARYLEK